MERERNRGGFGTGQEGCPQRMPGLMTLVEAAATGHWPQVWQPGWESVEGMAFHGGIYEDSSSGYLRLQSLLRKIQIKTPAWWCEEWTQCVLGTQHRARHSVHAQ